MPDQDMHIMPTDPDQVPLEQPRLPERYILRKLIGEGGMGQVWLADARDQGQFVRHVAIKLTVPRGNPDRMVLFEHELRNTAKLEHQHILRVLDFDRTEDGQLFIVMDYVPEGQTLRQIMDRGPLPADQAFHWLEQVASALDYAHEQAIAHGDLKPSNVLVDGDRILLADFGLSRNLHNPVADKRAGGTSDYMAPEQRQGNLIPASDIYALAVMACEMLTGIRPAHMDDLPRTLLQPIRALFAQALNPDPDQRPKNARPFVRAMKNAERLLLLPAAVLRYADDYVPRPDAEKAVLDELFNHGEARHVGIVALRGTGGIGKTTLAQAVCRNPRVLSHYMDGIAYVEVGKQASPDFAALIKELARQLGCTSGDFTSYGAALDTLRVFLRGKKALLVIDNLWSNEHADKFWLDVPGCCLLITTRKKSIAEHLNAQPVELGVMELPEAVAMLRRYARREDLDTAELEDVACCAGRLPKSLELVGARLKRGKSPQEWLDEYAEARRIRVDSTLDELEEAVEICFQGSISELRTDQIPIFYTLGIFPESIGIPVGTVARLWQHMNKSAFPTRGKCDRLIEALDDLALIELNYDTHTFTLHDLLHDYNVQQLEHSGSYATTQKALLEAYNSEDKPWALAASKERYLLEYLPYHLRKLGHLTAFYHLLTDSPDWMNSKHAVLLGDTSYVADLELAIGDFKGPVSASRLRMLARLWMARHVVDARTSVYTATDLETLVWLGRQAEALSAVRLRSQAEDRFDGLITIYQVIREQAQVDLRLLEEALHTAHDVADDDKRAQELEEIAILLAEAGHWEEALHTAHDVADVCFRAQALAGIATALTKTKDERAVRLLEEALHTAHDVADDDKRAKVLARIATALDKAKDERAARVWDEALHIAHDIRNDMLGIRARALANIGMLLAEAGRWEEALHIAHDSPDDGFGSQGYTWAYIAQALAKAGRWDEALHTAHEIPNPQWKANALAGIAQVLAEAGRWDEALHTAHEIPHDGFSRSGGAGFGYRALALAGIATALTKTKDERAMHVWEEALHTAHDVADNDNRARVLARIATLLAETQDERASHVWEEALHTAHDAADADRRERVLEDIVILLTRAGRWEEALHTAHEISSDIRRAITVADVSNLLAMDGDKRAARVWEEALRIAHDVADDRDQVIALGGLARLLAEEGRWEEALHIAHEITDADRRERVLEDIATALDKAKDERAARVWDEALHIAHNVADAGPYMLAEISKNLANAGRWEEALHTAHEIPDDDNRARLLVYIAKALANAGRWDEALHTAHEIDDVYFRARALAGIAPALAKAGRWEEVLPIAHDIVDREWQASALADIAQALAEAGRWEEALRTAHDAADVYFRAQALAGIAAALHKAKDERAARVWKEALHTAHEIPDDIFASRLITIGNIIRALAEAGLWEEALHIAHEIPKAGFFWRSSFLASIAQALANAGHWKEALHTAHEIDEDRPRKEALTSLANALAKAGCFTPGATHEGAFETFGLRNVEEFLKILATTFSSGFEQVQQGLSVLILQDTISIAGWAKTGWERLAVKLSPAPEIGGTMTLLPTVGLIPVRDEVRILFLVANPGDTTEVPMMAAYQALIERIEGKPRFKVIPGLIRQALDVSEYLSQYTPDIVYFYGHGVASGLIVPDRAGSSRVLSGGDLRRLFETAKAERNPYLRLVFLNACWSATQADALASAVGCTVGLATAVDRQNASIFADVFYRELVQGASVGNAFDQAEVALKLDNNDDEYAPRLFAKSDPYTIKFG